jgi:hypothetical protein
MRPPSAPGSATNASRPKPRARPGKKRRSARIKPRLRRAPIPAQAGPARRGPWSKRPDPAPATDADRTDRALEQLRELGKLKDAGYLTDAEFQRIKQRILDTHF